MASIPPKLREFIDDLALLDRQDRMQVLIETADRFEEVPERVATRPFSPGHLVPKCESQAYVWAEPTDDSLKFWFAVENPQGVSARALAVLLDESLSGADLETIADTSVDAVFEIFGKDITMGKGEGLTGMVSMVSAFGKEALAAARAGE
jgi:cysteine desulfuration protein SufE